MVCKNCGMANTDTATVCSECGSVLPRPKPAPAQPDAPQMTPPVPVSQPMMMPGVPPYGMAAPMYMPPSYAFSYMQQMPMYAPAPMPAPMPVPPVQAETAARKVPEPEQSASLPPSTPPEQAPVYSPAITANPNPFGVQVPTSGTASAASPYGYMPPYAQMPPYAYGSLYKDPRAARATTAMSLGIVSIALPIITCSYGSPISLILGIVALCLGAANMNKVFPQNRSKAIAGLITGIIGTVVSIGFLILMINVLRAFSSIDFEEFQKYYDQYSSFIAIYTARAVRFGTAAIKAVMAQLVSVMRLLLLR